MTEPTAEEGVRLNKLLAGAGVASRRAADNLISAGRVSIDGEIVRAHGVRVDPATVVVRVDGSRVELRDNVVHLALNKPRGVLSAMSDDRGRPTVADLVTEWTTVRSGAGGAESEGAVRSGAGGAESEGAVRSGAGGAESEGAVRSGAGGAESEGAVRSGAGGAESEGAVRSGAGGAESEGAVRSGAGGAESEGAVRSGAGGAESEGAVRRLFHVGRLDSDSEGLLLMTNDGELAHRLTHPSYEVRKTYLAEVPGPIGRDVAARLRDGVMLEDGQVTADRFRVVDATGRRALVEVVLHEGRKHVVRRMLAEVGHPVSRLVRTAIGPVLLGGQRAGQVRQLTSAELGGLYELVGL